MTDLLGYKEKSCEPDYMGYGLGQRVELIKSSQRKDNVPGFAMRANYWVSDYNGAANLYVAMTLESPVLTPTNALEMWIAFKDDKAEIEKGKIHYDIANCVTSFYGNDNLKNFNYEAHDYYFSTYFKGVPFGTVLSSVELALDTK